MGDIIRVIFQAELSKFLRAWAPKVGDDYIIACLKVEIGFREDARERAKMAKRA